MLPLAIRTACASLRLTLLLALALPLPALAAGPMVLDGPDLRQLYNGPMVYGGSDGTTCTGVPGVGLRCSDGRVSTTVAATIRQCETAPGVWTDVGVNVPCVNWRGQVDVWGSTTTLVAYGNDPTNAAWTKGSGITVAPGPDGGWRVTKTGSAGNCNQAVGTALGADETRTTACILKAPPPVPAAQVYVGNGSNTCAVAGLTNSWSTQSCTKLLAAGVIPLGGLNFVDPNLPLDLAACWHVKAATPGRPCWGTNASGTTCAADDHSISTDGWPATSGRICISAKTETPDAMLIDSRRGGGITFIRIQGDRISTAGPTMSVAGVWTGGGVVCLAVRNGRTALTLNGTTLADAAGAPGWGTSAYLGRSQGGSYIDGSISRLSWSNK